MGDLYKTVETQVLRGLVLEIAENAAPTGAGTDVMQTVLKQHGYEVKKDEILKACLYLQGKELVEVKHVGNDILKISRDIAHITPKGIDVLEGTETVTGIKLGD